MSYGFFKPMSFLQSLIGFNLHDLVNGTKSGGTYLSYGSRNVWVQCDRLGDGYKKYQTGVYTGLRSSNNHVVDRPTLYLGLSLESQDVNQIHHSLNKDGSVNETPTQSYSFMVFRPQTSYWRHDRNITINDTGLVVTPWNYGEYGNVENLTIATVLQTHPGWTGFDPQNFDCLDPTYWHSLNDAKVNEVFEILAHISVICPLNDNPIILGSDASTYAPIILQARSDENNILTFPSRGETDPTLLWQPYVLTSTSNVEPISYAANVGDKAGAPIIVPESDLTPYYDMFGNLGCYLDSIDIGCLKSELSETQYNLRRTNGTVGEIITFDENINERVTRLENNPPTPTSGNFIAL